jgi:hypothetical protein
MCTLPPSNVPTPARTSSLVFDSLRAVCLEREWERRVRGRGRGRTKFPIHIDKYKQARSGQSFVYFMPALSGNAGRATDGDPTTWVSITELQYDRFVKWANGQFSNSKNETYDDFSQIPPEKQPGTLT